MPDSTILTVIGTRPQLIKASVVSAAIRDGGLEEVLVDTGQHYDAQLSSVFFRELGIPEPDHNLGVGSGRHGRQTARMLDALEEVMLARTPELVVVYGDTNSTLAGVLAASKLRIPVAHVEAGLRSFNRAMAEEQNRVVADHLSDILFAPTPAAVDNLRREGISGDHVQMVGDVMLDAALRYAEVSARTSEILPTLGLLPKHFVLATIHRAENTQDPSTLAQIIEGLEIVGRSMPVVLPLHPRTREAVKSMGLALPRGERVMVIDPVGYLDMIALERHAVVIATDSGGVQKEAYFYRVPCVTIRPETEWTELVENGFNTLVEAEAAAIADAVVRRFAFPWPVHDPLFGDGNAARSIARSIAEFVNGLPASIPSVGASRGRSASVHN